MSNQAPIVPWLNLDGGIHREILAALIFAPGLLGTKGLALLVISVVNLQDSVLDGALCKLRDGKVAQFFLRQASE